MLHADNDVHHNVHIAFLLIYRLINLSRLKQPTKMHSGACTYSGEAGTKATIEPNKRDFENEEKITITCTNGTTTEHICTSGAFIPGIDQCYDDTISNSVVVTLSMIVAVMSALRILI